MKIKWRDKEYVWSPTNNVQENKSKLHIRARFIIKKVYPAYIVFEEVFLPGISLYADFIIFGAKVLVEVQGEQHYQLNSFFHKSKADLISQQLNDANKSEWCQLNGFRLVTLPYNESDYEWQCRIGGQTPNKTPRIN